MAYTGSVEGIVEYGSSCSGCSLSSRRSGGLLLSVNYVVINWCLGLQNKRSDVVVCRVGDHCGAIRCPAAMLASKILPSVAGILTILHA